jgi:hypothetical protein
MSMKNYAGNEVILVDKATGKEVKFGDKVVTSRGVNDVVRGIYPLNDVVRGIYPPHKPSSSGKVNMYYASVYGLEFREV